MKQIITTALLLVTTTTQAFADGKMFWTEEIPPKIPYQRSLILFNEGTETLILQSRYKLPEKNLASNLGWAVPVPAVPEVASMPADIVSSLFISLSWDSRPNVTRIVPMAFAVLFLLLGGLSLLTLLLCLVSFFLPLSQWFNKNRGKLALLSILGLLISFYTLAMAPLSQSANNSHGVDVIAEQRVGIYDVNIVRSDNTIDLINWLNKHNFKFGKKDTVTFDSYISKGWCFVVAIIKPGIEENRRQIVSEGLAAPLILRFPFTNPIYPVALTGTGGFATEILIYLASSTKMSCDNRLTLRYADEFYNHRFDLLTSDVTPKGFFASETLSYSYLSKFKSRLNPDDMNHDIVFKKAQNDDPYREHIVKWR